MRRDSKLMNFLLNACAVNSALEANDKNEITFGDDAYGQDTVKYHLGQLEEACYIKTDTNAKTDPMGHLRAKKAIELAKYHVTPKGHDRLAAGNQAPADIWS